MIRIKDLILKNVTLALEFTKKIMRIEKIRNITTGVPQGGRSSPTIRGMEKKRKKFQISKFLPFHNYFRNFDSKITKGHMLVFK